MINFKQRKQRFFEEQTDMVEIYQFLKAKFSGRPLSIKYDIENRDVIISDFFDDDNTLILNADPLYLPPSDNVMITSGLLDKYFEVDFTILEIVSPGVFKCKIKGSRRATTSRSDLRFKVKEGDAFATNFRVSKNTIDITNLNIPTGIKVILEQYTSQKKDKYDSFETGFFTSDDSLLKHIKRTGQAVLVDDLSNPDSYAPPTEDFVDLRKVLGADYQKYILLSKEKAFKSMMIVPLIYVTDSEMSFPFAYIKMLSKQKNFSIEDIFAIKEETFKLVDRIRESNTLLIDRRQKIADISRGGARISISDDELKKYIIKARGFVFDIVFRLQQPITIYGEIKFTGVDEYNNLIIGLSFAGNSSRKNEMQHLYSILKPMEVEYKKRLIASMKAKQGIVVKK